MNRLLTCTILLLLIYNGTIAQTDTTNHLPGTLNRPQPAVQDSLIRGKVRDAGGLALPGVTVTVTPGGNTTASDPAGNYSVAASPTDTLVFSFVGYTTLRVAVLQEKEINITLAPAGGQQLEQVVVVGYGAQRRRDVTGAVASVSGEVLARQPVQTPTQALQGRAAGVQVISSGAPNAQPNIRIRGTGTMLAGAEPLYVIDGILTNDIRNINNADIVSVDILKDAAAQAIYGLSGGNGVVIITTRQGKTGTPVIAYNGQAGLRYVTNKVSMANAAEYAAYQQDASPGLALPASPANTDWYDAILKTGYQQNHSLSLSGGSESVKYYFSAGYFGDAGIVLDNTFHRYTLRSNNRFNITNNLSFTAQLSYTHGRTRDVNLAAAYNNAYRAAPVVPAKTGNRYGNTSSFQNVGNPLVDIEKTNNRLLENRLQGSFGLEFKPVRILTLRSQINTDINLARRRIYNYQYNADTITFLGTGGNQRVDQSSLTARQDNFFSYTWDNTATYQQSFDDHDITLLAGFLVNGFRSEFLSGTVRNVSADTNLWYLQAGDPNTQTNDNGASAFNRISYLGRLNYSYDRKYLFTASVRYDGTSRFSPENRWLLSPALAAAWDITREDFLGDQKIFDLLKLRVSWGRVANENIDPGLFIVTATANIPYYFNGQPILGTAIQDIKNQQLQWETMEETDLALEWGALNNRLTGELTFYHKRTKNALVNVTIPAILGDPDQQYVTNAASFTNQGIEIGLSWNDRRGEDFSYRISANGTFNRNRIENLQQGQPLFAGGVGSQGFVTYSASGQPIGSFYVLQSLGIFRSQADINSYVNKNGELLQPTAQPGDLKYADINGDGVINLSPTGGDRIFAGTYQPPFYYGFNIDLRYRQFDLTADFYGNIGNEVYNGKKAFRYDTRDNVEANYIRDRWTVTNPGGTAPRLLSPSIPASTYFVEKGDYLRLNNLTLGFNLPEAKLEKLGLSAFRVYLTAQHLFMITSYSGFTPADLPGSPLDAGIELNAYPTSTTAGLGINLTFK